jgi:hypothetical protein
MTIAEAGELVKPKVKDYAIIDRPVADLVGVGPCRARVFFETLQYSDASSADRQALGYWSEAASRWALGSRRSAP